MTEPSTMRSGDTPPPIPVGYAVAFGLGLILFGLLLVKLYTQSAKHKRRMGK